MQIPVNEKKGLTFARGLRSILRHDPDKIMVGEIRDEETAQIAIQSALTGHLVFTTVHANNVIDVIGRFINMGVEPYNFVSALNCVLAQRLVRKLCPTCKRAYQPSEDELRDSGLRPESIADKRIFMSVGCDACNHTGYRGRTAIHELLDMSDTIREMIVERRPGSEIRRQAEKEGLASLRDSALKKVYAGLTTLYEINRVTFVEEIR
jgi:type IV pilus assembly protein PilB